MILITGMGMYLGYEFGKAGYKKGKQVAEASAELILTIVDLCTGKIIYDSISKNAALNMLGELVFTIEQLASYISGGILEEPRKIEFRNNIFETYVSALKTLGLNKYESESKKDKTDLDLNLDLDLDLDLNLNLDLGL